MLIDSVNNSPPPACVHVWVFRELELAHSSYLCTVAVMRNERL